MSKDLKYSLNIETLLREKSIKTLMCYIEKGMKQKFRYADKLHIPYVIVLGEDEQVNNIVTLKNMINSEQETLTIKECIDKLK